MSKALLIFFTLIIGVVFIFTPKGIACSLFPFSDRVLHVESYAYYLWEHAIKIVFAHVVNVSATSYRLFFSAVFWYQVADAVDYLLTYNDVWFKIEWFPVSMNVVGCAVCGSILIFEIWQHWMNSTLE